MSDSGEKLPARSNSGLSRRDLFRTAGLATGGALLLGLPNFLSGWSDTADAAIAKGQTFGNLALELEGQSVGFIGSAEGGHAFAETLPEPPGSDGIQRKRPGALKFEDLVIEVPLPVESKTLASWISETLIKGPAPKNGAIVFTDLEMNVVRRLEFSGGFLTEVGLPVLDAADPRPTAFLTLRIDPQQTRLVGGAGKLPKPSSVKVKQARISNFRLNIQGLEQAAPHIARIERITAKRLITTGAGGREAFAREQPALLDCSAVSLFLHESAAGPFYTWFDESVVKGMGGERGGLLELLSPTLKDVLVTVQLGGLGIVRFAPEPIKPGLDKLAMVRVDMYCETMNVQA